MQQDIWKFNPDDYFQRWMVDARARSGKRPLTPLEATAYKFAIREVDRLGTPVITNTGWIPENTAIMIVK